MRRTVAFRTAIAPLLLLQLLLGLSAGCAAEADTADPEGDPVAVDSLSAPTLRDTNYPIPAGALFVSTTGNDANPGTLAAPLRTIGAAISRAAAGGTVVIRGGTYREGFNSLYRRITLQPYPHERVWLKGSAVVGGWVADGAVWRRDGWTSPLCQTCGQSNLADPADPMAMKPDMVFVDGVPQRQVASRAAVVAGTFFMDHAARRIYLGTSPVGRLVEVTDRPKALQFNTSGANGSVVRGLGFAQYGAYVNYGNQPATVVIGSTTSGITFENNVVQDSASSGLQVSGSNHVVRGNTFWRNSFLGVAGNRADGLRLEGNVVANNNTEHLAASNGSALAASGIKVARSRNGVLRDNVIEDNDGTGFWCDLSCYNWSIVRNLVRRNRKHGIYYEVSARAIIASNVLADNASDGIKISGSNDVRVYNNSLVGNGQAVLVAEDARPYWSNCSADNCPSADEQALGITWDTRNVTLINNIYAGGRSGDPLFDTADNNTVASGKRVGAAGMIPASQMNRNGYYRASAGTPATLVRWVQATSTGATSYASLGAFQATGRDRAGLYQEGAASYFVDAARGDYRVVPGSRAASAGAPLPADVASAIGVTPGVTVSLGALVWPNMPSSPPPPPPPPADGGTTVSLARAVQRLTGPSGEELYTLSESEAQSAVSRYGYVSDGVAFFAAASDGPDVAPVYRLYNPTTDDRLITSRLSERDSAVANYGYTLEGVGFYAPTQASAGLVPVYRLQRGSFHRLAVGAAARDALVAAGWTAEAVQFYARPPS